MASQVVSTASMSLTLIASPEPNKASSEYRHSPLQQQDSIRLLRLLPSIDKDAPIQCQLFEYSLQGPTEEIHLYEALSYVWGSTANQQIVFVQSEDDAKGTFQTLLVTANLHVALKYLRSRRIARTIWIDAVCIDQKNNAEKGQQVQMMAKVYNFADRVVVFLGEATDNGDQALIAICNAATQQHTGTPVDASTSNQEAIIKLLQRPWFRRIWVLQEAAAARHILIKCGSVEINGYAFCSGLLVLNPYKDRPELQNLARSVVVLISGANFRPRYATNTASRFSLQIRPLAELVDMYHTRAATEPLDRFYALFGMSSDDLGAAGLSIDYGASWGDVFEKVVRLATSDQVLISTWDRMQVAFIRGSACVLGDVMHVEKSYPQDDRQTIVVAWRGELCYFAERQMQQSTLVFRAPATRVLVGDILVLLQGASKPTIVRLCDEHTAIVSTSVELFATSDIPKGWSQRTKPGTPATATFDWPHCLPTLTDFPRHVFLVWDWHLSQFREWDNACPYHKQEYECSLNSLNSQKGAACAEPRWQDCVDKAMRLWDLARLQYDKRQAVFKFSYTTQDKETQSYPDEILKKALMNYKMALSRVGSTGRGHQPWNCLLLSGVDRQAALSLAAWGGHETGVRLLLDQGGATAHAQDIFGRTPVFWAVMGGDEATVQLLLGRGADVDTQDLFHYTALSWAADVGNETLVKLLLDKGADVSPKNNLGRTALFLAAAAGHDAIAKLLLDKGANADTVDLLGSTPLSAAAICGHEPEIHYEITREGSRPSVISDSSSALSLATGSEYVAVVRLLLDNGANIETRDRNEQTPLTLAARRGHNALIKLLLDKGADIEATLYRINSTLTPLMHAIIGHHQAAVQLLLDKGANILAKRLDYETTLAKAAATGEEGIVNLLLDRGAEQFQKKHAYFYGLQEAAWRNHEAVVQLLLNRGGDINAASSSGRILLVEAADFGKADIVQLLLDKGADIDATDDRGMTALMQAEVAEHENIVQLLLDRGANVDKRDKYGKSLFLAAIASGNKSIVQLLLDRGANVEFKDYHGQTALFFAARKGNEKIAQLLLDKGANVDAKDYHGQTALFLAVREGNEKTAQLLLDKGANVDIKDESNRTPFSVAGAGNYEVLALLESYRRQV